MTHLPEEWAHRSFAERPTVEKKLTLAEIDKKIEELAKGLEELERTAAASKDESAAGPSSGPKPNKVTKPKAKKSRKFPIEEVIARLTQVAQHDPEARKILEKIWHGP
ncbi:hypothetical protein B0H65DRAFT_545841 [Neurospora tetraspora]|uniref:Uncharacterized protein n=1 Tax=Neurospora tetraspora TaxID=94610 RepID=A0AAE0JJE5_9PEZI|nr:hypothetical protein B0H65DRAFT_545841 [Neurospora tetraspora]